MRFRFYQCLALAMATVILTACGGGGSGQSTPTQVVNNYRLGGSVSGLADGESLVLGNGLDSLGIAVNGAFEFAPRDGPYGVAVTVLSQPGHGHQCAVNDLQHPEAPSNRFSFSLSGGPAVEVTCGAFPALSPPLPQVQARHGTAASIANAKILPVYFVDTPDQAQHSRVLQQLVASSFWSVLSQYGVGPAVVLPAITLPTAAPAQLNAADAQSFVTSHMAEWNPALDTSVFVMLYLPPTTTSSISACGAGYHSQAHVQGKLFAWAFMTGCNTVDRTAQHEVMEGLADPDGWNGFTTLPIDQETWALAAGNTVPEIGDLCEWMNVSVPDVPGVTLQPIWSNADAAAGGYPCVTGVNQQALLVGGVPQLTDMVTNTRDGSQVHALILAPGTSGTIPVKVFSTQPLTGQIKLSTRTTGWSGYTQGKPQLVMSLDKTMVRNGDTVYLTISVPAAPFTAWTAFAVDATYGSTTFSFPGAVANSSTY